MLKLLVVDDELVILQGIVKILREGKTPFTQIESAMDANEAMSILSHFSPDLIITDINMPEKNGLDFIEEVKEQKLCNRFIILTGYDEFAYAKQAIRIKVIDYMLKPIDKMEILSLLRNIAKEIIEEKDFGERQDPKHHDPEYSFHIEKILNYIQQNYQQDLSLEQFSGLTDLHPNYISYLFKKEIGMSLIHYLQGYRIEKAKELLMNHQNLPVQIIGNQVGYENPQHFMKVFKKIAGCTPGSYREDNFER
jgi:two-component system response regulator YesN